MSTTIVIFGLGLCLIAVQGVFLAFVLAKIGRQLQEALAKYVDQVKADVADQMADWLVPEKEGEASKLGVEVGKLAAVLGDVFAERMVQRINMSFKGEQSGAARRAKAGQAQLMPGMSDMAGMMSNPIMSWLASRFVPGLAGGSPEVPEENHNGNHSSSSKMGF